MDPITGTGIFATIVGLIGQYRGERKATADADFDDFMIWLSHTHHADVKALIESSHATTIGIKSLLKIQYEKLVERIDLLDKTLASYARGLPEFSSISASVWPNIGLSDQAVDILKQFDASGASKLLKFTALDGPILKFTDAQGIIDISDPRFLEDDLKTLLVTDLLRHDYNSKGHDLYIFTRAASELVKSMKS